MDQLKREIVAGVFLAVFSRSGADRGIWKNFPPRSMKIKIFYGDRLPAVIL